MSTRADYRASIRAHGYDGQSDAVLDEVIDEARDKLLNLHRWSYLQTASAALMTTINTAEVDLSPITDLGLIEGVRYTWSGTTYDLDWTELQDLRDKQAGDYPGATSLPAYWSKLGTSLVLWPTPQYAYPLRVDYIRTSDLLEGDTDVIPARDKQAVVWEAIVALAFRQREAWAMQYATERANSFTRTALDNDAKQSRSESTQVKPYWNPRYGYR